MLHLLPKFMLLEQ